MRTTDTGQGAGKEMAALESGWGSSVGAASSVWGGAPCWLRHGAGGSRSSISLNPAYPRGQPRQQLLKVRFVGPRRSGASQRGLVCTCGAYIPRIPDDPDLYSSWGPAE